MARLAGDSTGGPTDSWATKPVGPNGETQAQLDALAGQKSAADARATAAKMATDKATADKAAAATKALEDALAAAKKAQADGDAAAKAAAAKAVEDARLAKIASDKAIAEAIAAGAQTNINTSGNYVTPVVNTISADTAALEYTKAQDALNKSQARADAIATLTSRFQTYGLSSLAERIKALAIDGATEATITLSLQESPEYAKRFSANAARLKNNLRVLSPSEYLNLEDGYRQVLNSYGLTQFSTDDYVSQFISNDMSATELNTRVSTAVSRIQNADPIITKTLRDFYNIGTADLVGYVLDPTTNVNKIQQQISTAEIGAAARNQGLLTDVNTAAGLAAQGITQQQAQTGYANIGDILPTAEKLGQIYGTTYNQGTAEQEVFGQLASAKRTRQSLISKEQAAFAGSSGTNKSSLQGTPIKGQF